MKCGNLFSEKKKKKKKIGKFYRLLNLPIVDHCLLNMVPDKRTKQQIFFPYMHKKIMFGYLLELQ